MGQFALGEQPYQKTYGQLVTKFIRQGINFFSIFLMELVLGSLSFRSDSLGHRMP